MNVKVEGTHTFMADSYNMDWLGLVWQAMAKSKTPALTTSSNMSKQTSLDVSCGGNGQICMFFPFLSSKEQDDWELPVILLLGECCSNKQFLFF